MPRRIPMRALDVQLGDVLPGGMMVAEITHGPLPHQTLFRNENGTASACYYDHDRLLVEREGDAEKAARLARWVKLIRGYAREHASTPGWSSLPDLLDNDDIRILIRPCHTYSAAFRAVAAAVGASVTAEAL